MSGTLQTYTRAAVVTTLILLTGGCAQKYSIPDSNQPTATLTVPNYDKGFRWWIPAVDYIEVAHENDQGEECSRLQRVKPLLQSDQEKDDFNIQIIADGKPTYVAIRKSRGGLLGVFCKHVASFIPEEGKQYRVPDIAGGCYVAVFEESGEQLVPVPLSKAKIDLLTDMKACPVSE